VGLFVWSAWGFVDRHYPHLLGFSGDEDPVKIESARSKSNSTDYNINKLVAAHLFGKAEKVVVKKTENAPETKLKLKLLGVMSSEDEHYARALIQVSSKGMKSYAIGELIEGTDAQLHKVEIEKVILDRKGNLESLAMIRQKTKVSWSKPGTS